MIDNCAPAAATSRVNALLLVWDVVVSLTVTVKFDVPDAVGAPVNVPSVAR